MFLEIEDYKTVCGVKELDVLTQADSRTRERAERVALEEIAGYLGSRYDMATAYAAQGNQRNPHLVQMAVNIVLFYLVQWLPGKMASGNRADLYDRTIEWLVAAQKGNRTPQLPPLTAANPDDPAEGGFPVTYGSMSPQKHDY